MSALLLGDDPYVSRHSRTPQSACYRPPARENGTSRPLDALRRLRRAQEFCNDLRELVNDAASDGWDGPGTIALDKTSFEKMGLLLEALPDDFPFPTPSVTPAGRLMLEWTACADCSLVAMLGTGGRIHFSVLIPGMQNHGTFDFAGDELPAEFAMAARRWLYSRRNRR